MQAKRFNIFYFLADGAYFDIDICVYMKIHFKCVMFGHRV